MQAHQKFIRTAPRKIRLILDEIRGKNAMQAEMRLKFMPNQAALDIYSTVHAAIHNAKDQGKATETLVITKAICDEGPRLKRRILGSRGRSSQIIKQMSHIQITLAAQAPSNKQKNPKKIKKANKDA